ncbi:DUF309 domain-containing protein [Staphylococcus casei]|uniref:DUF309 domain-containing protein n=1 Tax=Staphylococcus TaxID=1279 RepID=UPI000CD28203|nr:DUF309 domain-containing protein [Staphylococcus casei]PNZ59740.1 DUF309 domain-containing protein [Staphylococcus casei]WJE85184.1 DUF309 domain-containing protein [Staphylococcus casei]
MENALQEFYYQFHTKQHYFLCHDILEEAWKENPYYSKDDAVVSLILLATGCYHYRRENNVGAVKSFNKALRVINQSTTNHHLGLKMGAYEKVIQTLITAVEKGNPFSTIQLPLTETMKQSVLARYPDFTLDPIKVEDSYIVHHHLERDRTEVHQARQQALNHRRAKR